MTDYIINPWFFYILDLVSSLHTVLILAVVFSFSGTIIWLIGNIIAKVNEQFNRYTTLDDGSEILIHEDDDYKTGRGLASFSKRFIRLFVIFSVLLIVIPSQDTILEMMIAKHATFTNAGLALDSVKDACDYVVNAIQSLK